MKKIKIIIGSLLVSLTLTSCIGAYGQVVSDDVYVTTNGSTVTYSTIITYGTPYYIDGVISYYFYDNIYYYPYLWENVWYFQPYRCIQPRGFIFRPGINHRPFGPLGDLHHRFNPNFGPHHFNFGPGRIGNGGRVITPNRGNMMPNRGIGNRYGNSMHQSSTRITGRQGTIGNRSFGNSIRPNTGMQSHGGFSGGMSRGGFSGGMSRGNFGGGAHGGRR